MVYLIVTISAILVTVAGVVSPEGKELCYFVGPGIALIGYGWTFQRIWWGKARPNPMSWIGFGFLTAVGAAVQHIEAGFVPAITMYLTAVCCFIQGGARLVREAIWKEGGGWHWRDFPISTWEGFGSWASLVLGVACFTAFALSKQIGMTPFWAAVSATTSDLLLYVPIIITSWSAPRSEVPFGYFMQSMKNGPAIAALPVYTPEAWMYNAMLLVMNLVMIGFFEWRKTMVTEEEEELRSKKSDD